MSEASASVTVSSAVTKQNFSIFAIKQQQRADQAILQLVSDAVQTTSQSLSSSGRGQVVNLLT